MDDVPMPDRKIARKCLSWQGNSFNELMDLLDIRANSSLKQSARKERFLSSPVETHKY